MRSITLEVAANIYDKKGSTAHKITVPLDMYLEAHLHLSLAYPWQDVDGSEGVDVRPLRLNHQKRDVKGRFTK